MAAEPGPKVAKTSSVVKPLELSMFAILQFAELPGDTCFPVVVGPQSVLLTPAGNVPFETLPLLPIVAVVLVMKAVSGRLNPPADATATLACTKLPGGIVALGRRATGTVMTGTPIWKL